jgi:hypothetical protein
MLSLAKAAGPCDVFTIFPKTLQEYDWQGNPTQSTVGDLPLFGRLHGALHDALNDAQNRFVNMDSFVRGGYVGIVDAQTRQAVALFRVTEFDYEGRGNAAGRSVHMSTWSEDGNAILIANLHGKAMEQIDVVRHSDGTIVDVSLNTDASLGLGKGMSGLQEANYFRDTGAFGAALFGQVTGNYQADLGGSCQWRSPQ